MSWNAGMSSADAEASRRFTLICPKCERPIAVRAAWIGTEVRCPHCSAVMGVPSPRAGGQPVRGSLPGLTLQQHRFSFICPRCESLLESQPEQSGRTGTCPTCGARFVVPPYQGARDVLRPAALIDSDDQDPTPLHAYAASGHQAPRIHRGADGTPEIECPRCGRRSDITANNCSACRAPFTIEGVPTVQTVQGDALGTASLVLGIVGIPLCALLVPAGLAVVLGLASWLRRSRSRPSGHALAGIVLGLASLGLGLLIVFF